MRVFFYFAVILFYLSSCTSKSIDAKEAANNDSIQKYLDLAGDNKISKNKRIYYNANALKFIDMTENSLKKREFIYQVITNYHPLDSWDKYKMTTDLLYKSSLLSNDNKGLAQSCRSYGNYYYNNRILDSAFYFYTKSEKIYRSINDVDGCSEVLIKKGILQYEITDFLAANLTLSEAYFFAKKTSNSYNKWNALNLLGLTSNQLSEFDDAINYFNKAIELSKSNDLKNKKRLYIVCISNIGLVCQNLKKHELAIKYFKSSLELKNLKNDYPMLYSNTIDNLAYSKFEINDYSQLPELFFESLNIRNKIKDTSAIITSTVHLSEFYSSINQKQKALYYANKSLSLSRVNKKPIDLLFSLKQALRLDKVNCFKYADEYLKILDSLQLAERNSKARFDRIQLKTEEITEEKETAIKQKWIIGVISGAIILIVILLLIITRQRNKQKEFKLLQEQQKANEEIYHLMLIQKAKERQARQNEKRRIAIELHDGVMNKLASTRLNLDILNHKKDSKTIDECLNYIAQIYQIEQEIRSISHDLAIEDFNSKNSFIALINDFIITQNNISGSKYILEMEEIINWDNVSSSIKMNLFRIIQEASHNINKFSHAKTAIISFILDDCNVCLSITDDGKGFDTEINFEGIGLKNIKQRVDSLKGKFVIQSIKGKSTSLNIAIPFA